MQKILPLLLVSTAIFQFSTIWCQEEVPSFRIVAPQTLCKHDTDDNEPSTGKQQADGITVAFQPKDGIKLSYKFKIFFKILGPDPLTQRETLLVWKAVRALEQQLNTKERLQISKDNMAMISKRQVVPGVSYIFHVVGITDAGETTREQVFTLDYADGVLQNSNVPEGINLLLIGSEEIVANMQYNVVARVGFCKPKYDYYVQWHLEELEGKYRNELERVISSVLIIPANVLMSERKTSVEAQVREWQSKRLLAKEVIMVEVLNKGFQAMIVPTAARIGQGTSLTFRVFLRNFDMIMEANIKWLLRDANTKMILMSREDKENEFRVKFEKAGLYQVLANVSINDISSKVKAEIEVVSSLFVSYDFQQIPNLNPSSTEEFRFSVMAMNLVANCEASWLSAQEDGFQYIAPGVLDKEHYGYSKVSNLEKYYLEEIIDFSNSTVNREITLQIPAAGKEMKNELTWPGFEGDAMYKFRLDVTCPKPFQENRLQMEAGEEDHQEEPWKRMITSYFTIDLHTNSPPQALRVFMEPLQGIALKTIFNFNSQEAKDLLLDSPVRYELKIKWQEFILSIGQYFQYKSWQTILPFGGGESNSPLEIMVEICDIRQACSQIRNDTQLQVHYEELSDVEYEEYLKNVNALFMRTDYQEGLNLITMALLTFRNGHSQYRERFEKYTKVLISKELDKLLEQPEHQVYINPDITHLFVEKSKQLLDFTQQMDKATLEKLIEILDNIIDSPSAVGVEDKRFKRLVAMKRSRRIVNQNQDLYQHTQLLLLEDLLKAEEYKPEAMNKFMEKLSKLSQKLCLKKNLNMETLKSNMVSVTLKQIKGGDMQQTTHISEDIFDKITLHFKLLQNNAKYCLVIKTYNFPGDFPNDDDDEEPSSSSSSLLQYNIYEIMDDGSHLKEFQLQSNEELNSNQGNNIQLDIYPLEQRVNKCFMKSTYNSQWSMDTCKSLDLGNFLRCSCSQTGFVKTVFISSATTTTWRPPIRNRDTTTPQFSLSSPLPTFISLTTRQPSIITTTLETTQIPFTSTLRSFYPTPNGISTIPTFQPTPPVVERNTVSDPQPTAHMEIVQRAGSPFYYIIPLILILLFLIVTLLAFLYRRRMQQTAGLVKNIPPSTVLESRKPASGIKYANIQDVDMLSGNF
ncbi:uncharacterized protein LOC131803395 [Musca domestica]|uniref:Uncharacterized protein LOC131803395 n=1 Tax=Musca domestica TaxID=7370 RepID=A0ABM3V4D4_MUSDO|nr:uncharacterized protein LOC131803395 [Musca domestica]